MCFGTKKEGDEFLETSPEVPAMTELSRMRLGNRSVKQMNHYFDYKSYEDSINSGAGKQKRIPRFSKAEVKILKQRKAAIKKKKVFEWMKSS